MGRPTAGRLGGKLVVLGVLLVLFLVAFLGFVWLFVETVLLSSD